MRDCQMGGVYQPAWKQHMYITLAHIPLWPLLTGVALEYVDCLPRREWVCALSHSGPERERQVECSGEDCVHAVVRVQS